MEQFKSKKRLEDIIPGARLSGWKVDTKDHDKGGDFVWFTNKHLEVAYNTFNGQFSVYDLKSDKLIATEKSDHLDDIGWYSALLRMFYISK